MAEPSSTTISDAEREIIREQVRDFLQTNFLFADDTQTLDDDMSLAAQGILDGTGVLELVLFVEETYGLHVEEEDLQPENFDTVTSVVEYIAEGLSEE